MRFTVNFISSDRIDELVSEQSRHLSSGKQKDERLQTLKTQLEDYVNKNHSLNSELNMKEERLKALKKRYYAFLYVYVCILKYFWRAIRILYNSKDLYQV